MIPMLSPDLRGAIEKIAEGQYAALVFTVASNEVNPHEFRAIIRAINTAGGRQLALHQVSMARTESGTYGDVDLIAALAQRMENHTKASPVTQKLGIAYRLGWYFVQDADLPHNLQPV